MLRFKNYLRLAVLDLNFLSCSFICRAAFGKQLSLSSFLKDLLEKNNN